MQWLKFLKRSKTGFCQEMEKGGQSQLLEKNSEGAQGSCIKCRYYTFTVAFLFTCTFLIIWVYASQENENLYELAVEKWPSYDPAEEKEMLSEEKQSSHETVNITLPLRNPVDVVQSVYKPADENQLKYQAEDVEPNIYNQKHVKQSEYHSVLVKWPAYNSPDVKQPGYNAASVTRPLFNLTAMKRPTYRPAVVKLPKYQSAVVDKLKNQPASVQQFEKHQTEGAEPKGQPGDSRSDSKPRNMEVFAGVKHPQSKSEDENYSASNPRDERNSQHISVKEKQLQCTSTGRSGNGFQFVFFLQTVYSSALSTLLACAIESAARTYENKTVRFYIKGLKEYSLKNSVDPVLHFLTSLEKVEICPLDPDLLLKNTPLQRWYDNADPAQEEFWTHVQSDAFRYAVLWQYGGLYLDTDVITFKPIPDGNFLGYQSADLINGAILSSTAHSAFLQSCMEDFVNNYQGASWGHQGPQLLTRVLQKLCSFSVWDPEKDYYCKSQDVTICRQASFYSIPYQNWKMFYSPSWDMSIFKDSYAAHVWNQMNEWNASEKQTMKKGDDTLLTNMFKKYCPRTHEVLL